MAMYGKIQNGELIASPNMVQIENTYYLPPPKQWLEDNGYKLIEETEPQNGEDIFTWIDDGDKIIQEWSFSSDEAPERYSAEEFIRLLEAIL